MGTGRKAANVTSEGNRVLRLLLYIMVLTSLYCVVYVLNQGNIQAYIKSPFLTSDNQFLSREDNTNATPGFTIYTSSCKIPYVDPFDHSVKKFLSPPTPIKCNDKPPLLVTEGQTLKVNHKALSAYRVSNVTLLECCYQKLMRVQQHPNNYNKDADNLYKFSGPCIMFEEEVHVNDNFVRISCKFKGKEIYKNLYAFFGLKAPVIQKIKRHKKATNGTDNSTSSNRPLSVLLVGIDSVSRLNMVRYLDKTAEFLKSKGAMELHGFVKVGDNTFPNLIPELTGLEPKDLTNMCWKSAYKKLDNCPFLWKNFSTKGYVTAYSEDEPMIGIFNYHKTGFVVPPGDFYLRPVVLASVKELPTKKRDGFSVCVGDRLMVDVILDHADQFAHVFKDTPYFGLFWTNSLTHNNVNSAAIADRPYLRFFQSLFEDPQTLNHTLLVFFSDHGIRFGRIRETYLGWLEERMPFFMIRLPDWFQSQHPEAVANLRRNTRRLTSPFDVYYTLLDVLNNKFEQKQPWSARGQSLFQLVPYNRTCSDAGISPHWCTCQASHTVSANNWDVQASAKYILDQLNIILAPYNQCSPLELKEVVSSRVFKSEIIASSSVAAHNKAVSDFLIAFNTIPGGAVFEGTVRFTPEANNFRLMGPISRISRYAGMSDCVDDFELRKYCYCVHQPAT